MDNKSCCSPGNGDSKDKRAIIIRPKVKIPAKNASLTSDANVKSSCCGKREKCSADLITQYDKNYSWIIGEVRTDAGLVPQVSVKLGFSDTLGAWKVRWGINRMNYKINPGIYAVGEPDKDSPVLVTANYKLTFDTLRKELAQLNAWILVLDTRGVNVWCAAGKGTFGTKELVNRVKKVNLPSIVTHNTLILPQLGAPGVSAHEVAKATGFKVVYGPVRAKDIKQFFRLGMKATDKMRQVRFGVLDRLVLTPMELAGSLKSSMIIFGILFLLNLIAVNPFGSTDFLAYAGALIVGCVITPVLLPWIPGRAFAWKGWLAGLIWATAVIFTAGWTFSSLSGLFKALGYLLVLPSISAFYAMNFTGASTYTSLSGVYKEMKAAVPAIACSIGLGSLMLLIQSIIKL